MATYQLKLPIIGDTQEDLDLQLRYLQETGDASVDAKKNQIIYTFEAEDEVSAMFDTQDNLRNVWALVREEFLPQEVTDSIRALGKKKSPKEFSMSFQHMDSEMMEALLEIGHIEFVFTIESESRADAVMDILDRLNDYYATHKGIYTPSGVEERVKAQLKRKRKAS